jgi:hypothetical protein
MFKKHFATITLLTGLLLATTSQSLAQESTRITAIPPRLGDDFSLHGKPGSTIETTIQVKNSSDIPLTLTTAAEDFIVDQDTGDPIPVKEDVPSNWSLASWLTIAPTVHSLAPREIAQLKVIVKVPTDALPGGHYAMILHSPSSTSDTANGSGSSISQRVGTLLYFVVDGQVNEEAYIRQIENHSFFEFGPVPFSFKIENRSDIHLRPHIQVEIRNMLGQKIDTFQVETQNIFPGNLRSFSDQWSRKWGVGRYAATILASYGSQGKIIQGQFYFWMFPIRLFLIGALLIACILSVIIFFGKKRHQQKKEKHQEQQLLTAKRAANQKFLDQFKDETSH